MVAIALTFCFCSWPVFAKKKVHWKGNWVMKISDTSSFPIIGNVEESGELFLEFTEDLGDVVVTVADASGKTVYQEITFNCIRRML